MPFDQAHFIHDCNELYPSSRFPSSFWPTFSTRNWSGNAAIDNCEFQPLNQALPSAAGFGVLEEIIDLKRA